MKIENNHIVDRRKVGRVLEVYRKSDRMWMEKIHYIPIEKKNLIIRGNKHRDKILQEHGYNGRDYYFIEEADIYEIKIMSLDIFEKYAKSTHVVQLK